jgi:hypothetical protein
MIFHCCPVDLIIVEHFGQAVCIFRQSYSATSFEISISLHALTTVVSKKRSGKNDNGGRF